MWASTPATRVRAKKLSWLRRSTRHCGMCSYRLLSPTAPWARTVSTRGIIRHLGFCVFPAYVLPCSCAVTVCVADLPTTTVAPTTPSTTPVTTTPTPTLPAPTTGNYSLKPDDNSTACLLASFGLRIGIKQENVRPPLVQSSGDPQESPLVD